MLQILGWALSRLLQMLGWALSRLVALMRLLLLLLLLHSLLQHLDLAHILEGTVSQFLEKAACKRLSGLARMGESCVTGIQAAATARTTADTTAPKVEAKLR